MDPKAENIVEFLKEFNHVVLKMLNSLLKSLIPDPKTMKLTEFLKEFKHFPPTLLNSEFIDFGVSS